LIHTGVSLYPWTIDEKQKGIGMKEKLDLYIPAACKLLVYQTRIQSHPRQTSVYLAGKYDHWRIGTLTCNPQGNISLSAFLQGGPVFERSPSRIKLAFIIFVENLIIS
jgi:hypothetical protein